MDNWFDRILLHARTAPETPAIVMEDRVVTYGMLGAAIENCARRIVDANIDRSGVVVVLVQNPIRTLTLCLALFRIGVRCMPLEPGQSAIASLNIAVALSDAQSKQSLHSAGRIIEVTDAWFAPEAVGVGSIPAPFSDGRQVCLEALTSGTTGAPKTIPTTVDYIARYVGPGVMEPGGNVVLCMLGLGSVWGYTISCSVLASRKTLCFVISPFQAIRMVELFSVDFVFASTDQLVALIRVVRKSGAQLRSLRTVVTGGSVPTRALLEAATLHLCKNVLCRYGTSELGSVAEASASEILAQPTLVGHIQPEYEMAVVTTDGAPCPPGKPGLIRGRVRRNDPGGPEPWTDNGDLGWMSSDGRLFVVGRTADIQDFSAISVGKFLPEQEVEHLLRFEWDAADAAAVLGDRPSSQPEIWVGVVDCKDADASKLEAILRRRGIPGSVRLFALTAIPRGANGKVQRGRLKSILVETAAAGQRTEGP